MRNFTLLLGLVLLMSCKNKSPDKKEVSKKDSIVRISVDESFEPVIKEQIQVFESSFPGAQVLAEYKPEVDCFKDLENDSTKVVIISRALSRKEEKHFAARLEFNPAYAELAKDAIAVIVNKNSSDSIFTVEDLKKLLSGTSSSGLKVAIDGNSATSTVRYLRDSLLKGGSFGKDVSGAKSSEDLIKYISTTDNAVGFVGISWVSNPRNPEQENAVAKVKMALIECKTCEKDTYAKPSQQTITYGQYPLVRGLYYVLQENRTGLGSRFVDFLKTERGQLIFRRALLFPVKMRFERRTTNL